MRVLEVGCDFQQGPADGGKFRSTQSFLDYDLIVWNPNTTRNEYVTGRDFFVHEGRTILKDYAFDKLNDELARRRNELIEMMNLGRSVVVWASNPQATTLTTIRNHRFQHIDLLSVLPADVRTNAMSGRNIEFRGDEPFRSFWMTNQGRLRYEGQVAAPGGNPLFFIKGTDKAVGTHLSVGRGNLLVLPSLSDQGLTNPPRAEAENDYVLSLTQLIEKLDRAAGEPELPPWSSNYLLPHERENIERLEQLEEEMKAIQAEIHREADAISGLRKYKLLFSGSGKPLERQVRQVFEELGFSVVEFESNRDDLIMAYEDRIAVVEIKGTSKSAAERHAAQLEKWVSEYYSSHEVEPKGILVINAYKDTPLADRTNAPFPDQMIGYSQRRSHCLISGLQLLGLYLDCKDSPEKKARAVEALFDTQGLLDSYLDWTDFLARQGSNLT